MNRTSVVGEMGRLPGKVTFETVTSYGTPRAASSTRRRGWKAWATTYCGSGWVRSSVSQVAISWSPTTSGRSLASRSAMAAARAG